MQYYSAEWLPFPVLAAVIVWKLFCKPLLERGCTDVTICGGQLKQTRDLICYPLCCILVWIVGKVYGAPASAGSMSTHQLRA